MLPLRARAQDTVHWLPRERDGAALVDAVRSAAFDAAARAVRRHGYAGVGVAVICLVLAPVLGFPWYAGI